MTRIHIYAGLGVCIMALLLGLYWRGYFEGRKSAEIQRLRAAVIAEKQRRKIENDLKDNSSHALCLELGGLPDLCDPLRRMDTKPESQSPSKTD